MDSVLWVMPQTRFVADALGVVTICLVVVLVLLGLFCIIYTFYFRNQILSHGLAQLNYFSAPWIIRITFIFFSIWWGIGEIIRLNLLRHNGGILDALNSKWQENICKCYIVSNLGFAEPCLFLTLVFLLRASLQKCGTLSQKWNKKTSGFVLLYCFPVFFLQLIVILIGPQYKDKHIPELPSYFIKVAAYEKGNGVALCTYPLLSTIFLGLFATVLTVYLFWLGTRILGLVINKGLQRRVYALIISISSIFPLRVVLLGLSVLSNPEQVVFHTIVFLAFFVFLCCVGVGICILVYLPIADSLALRSLQMDVEVMTGDACDTSSLVANQSRIEGSVVSNRNEDSDMSPNSGSISFNATKGGSNFVELSLFNSSDHSSSPGSPPLFGWPMAQRSPPQGQEP